MFRIPSDKSSNLEVLEMAQEKKNLIKTQKLMRYLNQIPKCNSIQYKELCWGKKWKGKKARTTQKHLSSNVQKWTHLNDEECPRVAQRWTQWRFTIIYLLQGKDTWTKLNWILLQLPLQSFLPQVLFNYYEIFKSYNSLLLFKGEQDMNILALSHSLTALHAKRMNIWNKV